MKSQIQVKSGIVLAVILAAVTLSASPRIGLAQSKAPKLNQRQLNALISNAKTPEDHQKLADYYRQQARALAERSEEHAWMVAGIYKKWLTQNMSKQLSFSPGYCRYFAERYAQQARDAEALASYHEEKAKAVAHNQN